MAALAHSRFTNPGKDSERYEQYAFAHAKAAGVVWQKPSKGSEVGKLKHGYGAAFIAQDDSKVIEVPRPNTLYALYAWMHELAHHYNDHINSDKPYHVEEYEATKDAIDAMERDGFTLRPGILKEAGWNIAQAVKRDRKDGVRIEQKAVEYAAMLERGVSHG